MAELYEEDVATNVAVLEQAVSIVECFEKLTNGEYSPFRADLLSNYLD